MTPNTDMTPLDFCLKWKLPPEARVELEKAVADARLDELESLIEWFKANELIHAQSCIDDISRRIAKLKGGESASIKRKERNG